MKNYLTFVACANCNKKLFEKMKLTDDEAYEICRFLAENALLEKNDISYDEFMEYLEKADFKLFNEICNTGCSKYRDESLKILEDFLHENYKIDGEGNIDVIAGIISYAMTIDSSKDLFEYLCIALPFAPKVLLARVSKYNPFNEENTDKASSISNDSFISVDERLPELNETVLVRFRNALHGFIGKDGKSYKVSNGLLDNGDFEFENFSVNSKFIDAWMPLPY